MCDVPFHDNYPPLYISKDHFEGFSDSNDDSTSIDDDSFSIDDIDSGSTTTRSDYSLPDYEAFYDHIEEKSSGSTTTHADFSQYDSFIFDLSIHPFPPAKRSDFYHEEFVDELAHIISPPEYNCFYFKNELELGNFTMDVVEEFFINQQETTSSFSFPSETRNKIFDPGISIEVPSEKFLSRDEFSISFIRDPLSPMIDTFLPFLSKNEDKVVNSVILAADEEKSPHPSSYRGLRDFNESTMMISGEDIPILDVPFLHFYPP
ncbi:hypothetical protein Tco_1343506 [Tanacetum coccineum]